MGALQRLQNHYKHRLGIQQHIVVPETHNLIAALSEFTIPTGVIFLLRQMLPAIHLNDDLSLHAGKIGDVIANWHLPPKSESRQLSIA
jgi:hypothetical protein